MPDPVITALETGLSAPAEHSRRQLEALLEVSEAIAQQRDLPALFHDLATRLHSVVDFDFLTVILHDPVRNVMRLHILETEHPTDAPIGKELSVEGHPSGWVWQRQEPFVVSDTHEETRYPEYMQVLREKGVRAFALVPLTTAQRRVGAMGFGRMVPDAVLELPFMLRVASQVAVAVDNALNVESSQAYQRQLARERDRLRVLLDLNNVLVTSRELPELFRGIVSTLQRVIRHEYTSLALLDPMTGLLKIYALEFPGHQGFFKPETVVPRDSSPAGRAIAQGKTLVACGAELDEYPSEIVRQLRAEGIETICCIPLTTRARAFGTLNLASRSTDAFSAADIEFVQQVAAQIAIAVENALAFKEIDVLKDKLAVEKLYLEEEIRTEFNFEEIIGESAPLKRTLAQVELAAPAGTTVLILGETGTGKELIARAIHNLSPRRERTFVKINCAAIPSGLLESELFGNEGGAFTGAISQKVGRFELADRGTLFLDEIADLPLELQPKLLRVLQEQEFERLGANRTLRVDVRVVVRYFVQTFSRRQNKTVEYIPADVMDSLVNYSWPGNIRELENLIERAVLLSTGKELRVPIGELKAATAAFSAAAGTSDQSAIPMAIAGAPNVSSTPIATLEDADRQHILRALRQTNWRIAGPQGAATLLGMKRTTLQARIRKLGIKRPV